MNSTQPQQDVVRISAIQAVPQILDVVTATTGARFAAVARVTHTHWICCAAKDEVPLGLQTGATLELGVTLCNEVRRHGREIVFDDVQGHAGYAGHPAPAMYGFRSYISIPIRRADGEFFGTLCALDPEPLRLDTPETLGMFRLFAQLIGVHLDMQDRLAGSGQALADSRLAAVDREDRLAQEQRRAQLFSQVARASRRMNEVLSVKAIAQTLTEEARTLIGAHQAVTSLTMGGGWAQSVNALSVSPRYAKAFEGYENVPDGSGIYAQVCRTNTPARMTQAELVAHPAWRGFGADAGRHPPMNGWLAVPLVGHGGTNLGLVQLSDKAEGEFTEEDEAILVQLASIASVSIENAFLYEQLREQDRRKGEFLAVLAHELRNPLAPLRTGMNLLAMPIDEPRRRSTLAVMERQLSHMVRLIDDLMDIARISTGKVQLVRERVDLRIAVEAALESCRPAIDAAGHDVQMSLPGQPLWVDADRTRLTQVIGNVINNAAKYTPPGGRIAVEAAPVDGSVRVRVTDNGVGIPPEMQAEVFEMFTQDDRDRKQAQGGLGIGLALVKQLVEMHDGTVRVESAGRGAGSSFFIELPRAVPQAQEAATAHGTSGAAAQQPLRVLVVDDNEDAAETLAALLEMKGHAPRAVHTGQDALAAFVTFSPHCVLLDIGLPDLSGYEVAARLRTMGEPSPPAMLVALTGWGGEDDRRRASDAGFDFHLTKPVSMEQLDTLLAQAGQR